MGQHRVGGADWHQNGAEYVVDYLAAIGESAEGRGAANIRLDGYWRVVHRDRRRA